MATTNGTCRFGGCDRIATSKGTCKPHRKQEREGRALTPLRGYEPRPCAYGPCERHARTKGLCAAHYTQRRRGEELHPVRIRANSIGPCGFDGCSRFRYSREYCEIHLRMLKNGTPLRPIVEPRRGCSFEGCPKPHDTRGLCASHAKQHYAGLPLSTLRTVRPANWSPWRKQATGYVARWRSDKGVRTFELQHRRFMEDHLGRALLPNENVHHINGDRSDNRLENLELWSTSQPSGQRVEDKVAWAVETLALYRPEALSREASQVVAPVDGSVAQIVGNQGRIR